MHLSLILTPPPCFLLRFLIAIYVLVLFDFILLLVKQFVIIFLINPNRSVRTTVANDFFLLRCLFAW